MYIIDVPFWPIPIQPNKKPTENKHTSTNKKICRACKKRFKPPTGKKFKTCRSCHITKKNRTNTSLTLADYITPSTQKKLNKKQ